MFATILGGLPRPPLPADASPDEMIAAAIAVQEAAGLEPLTDGRLVRGPAAPVATWIRAAALTARAVKQALPGPYTLAVQRSRSGGRAMRRRNARAIAEELAVLLREFAAAGCPLIEIEESEAHRIGEDPAERKAYRDAHAALTDGVTGAHLSLAIVGGNADKAGIQTILAPAYASLAVDLIAGPDNWRLVTAAPPSVGIVVGAMSSAADGDEGPEMVLWAARYAASGARGSARVGVALVPGLERLPWEVAVRKINALGHAARLAALSPGDELASAVDPRSIDIRSAAVGRRRRR